MANNKLVNGDILQALITELEKRCVGTVAVDTSDKTKIVVSDLKGTKKSTFNVTSTVDSSLSASSTNPVQNKVIKAELDKKLNIDASGIASSSDLNTYLTPGFYATNANATAATIKNSPTTKAFALHVWGIANGTIIYQEIREYNNGSSKTNRTWIRSYYKETANTYWSAWVEVATKGTTLANYGITDAMKNNAQNTVSVGIVAKRNVDTSYLQFVGGSAENKGSWLALYGMSETTHQGGVLLRTNNGSASADLTALPTGSLTWNGKNIVRSVNNVNADVNGNVSLTLPVGDVTQQDAGYWKKSEAVKVGDTRYLYGRANTGIVLVCTKAGTTGSSAPSVPSSLAGQVQPYSPVTVQQSSFNYLTDIVAKTPNYYDRPSMFTSAKTTITIPKGLRVRIGNNGYESASATTLNLTSVGTLANLAAKDVYVYACQPSSGTSPVFVLSLNSTVPSGYTSSNSRKIGGFHCLCANVGTINGHKLSGYVAGNILPASCWDLVHRPRCSPEGMVYCDLVDYWVDIYLASWDGNKLVSKYNGVCADGTSTKKWHGELFVDEFAKLLKRPVPRRVFQTIMKGSNESTAIKGASDANTTGGHLDTAGRRMISNYGCEDGCGFMWQWAYEIGFAGGSGWGDSVYNSSVDSSYMGATYGGLYRAALGGYWDGGSSCGSRSVACNSGSAGVSAYFGGRGSCEPKTPKNFINVVEA